MAPKKTKSELDYPFVRAEQTGRSNRLHFFCPLCKYHQSTSTIDRVQLRHHAQILLVTLSLTLLAYPLIAWNGLLFYLPVWGAFEFFYRLRKRQALVCQSCGFDPFLYKQDVHKAREALKQHWQTRIEKENLFANLKLKNYQTARVKSAGEEAPPKGAEDLKNPDARPPKSP